MPYDVREIYSMAEETGRAEGPRAESAGRDRGIHDRREEEAALEAEHGEEKKALKKERDT
jgi:hypothetical protein